MTVAILYHRGCNDGFASAAVANLYYSTEEPDQKVAYYALDPGKLAVELKPILELPEDTEVISIDVGYTAENFKLLKDKFKKLMILDHHKTTGEAFETLPPEIHFENEYCGCVLAWRYFFPECKDDVPLFLKYLQDRDLWQQTMPDSEMINAGLFHMISFDFDEEGKPIFKKWVNYMLERSWVKSATEIGKIMLEQKKKDLFFAKKSAKKMKFMCDGVDYDVMVINASTLVSDVGNMLVEDNLDTQFAIMYRIVGDEVYISLRSRKDFDCSKIAKYFLGGGHAQASGMSAKFGQLRVTSERFDIVKE